MLNQDPKFIQPRPRGGERNWYSLKEITFEDIYLSGTIETISERLHRVLLKKLTQCLKQEDVVEFSDQIKENSKFFPIDGRLDFPSDDTRLKDLEDFMLTGNIKRDSFLTKLLAVILNTILFEVQNARIKNGPVTLTFCPDDGSDIDSLSVYFYIEETRAGKNFISETSFSVEPKDFKS